MLSTESVVKRQCTQQLCVCKSVSAFNRHFFGNDFELKKWVLQVGKGEFVPFLLYSSKIFFSRHELNYATHPAPAPFVTVARLADKEGTKSWSLCEVSSGPRGHGTRRLEDSEPQRDLVLRKGVHFLPRDPEADDLGVLRVVRGLQLHFDVLNSKAVEVEEDQQRICSICA